MKRAATLLVAACATLILLGGAAQANQACDQMRGMLTRGGGAASGLIVVESESRDVVCAKAPGRQRPLASNMKLFTTATALSRLGPKTRIPTKVFGDGRIDAGGVLRGSLYADDTIFDRRRGVADSGYATSSYIGPLSGLAFNSGFSGSTSSSGFSSDPAKLAASKLARSLRAAGVAVPPQVAIAPTPPNAERVALIRSPTVHQLANMTDVYSNNFFAETLIKLLGARLG